MNRRAVPILDEQEFRGVFFPVAEIWNHSRLPSPEKRIVFLTVSLLLHFSTNFRRWESEREMFALYFNSLFFDIFIFSNLGVYVLGTNTHLFQNWKFQISTLCDEF